MGVAVERDPDANGDASCCASSSLSEQRRDVAPSIEAPQPDLAAGHEAEEEHQRGVRGGQAALGLHAPAELLVQPLNDIRGAQRLPLPLRKLEEREQLLATLLRW
jgi:hypothetical protein